MNALFAYKILSIEEKIEEKQLTRKLNLQREVVYASYQTGIDDITILL